MIDHYFGRARFPLVPAKQYRNIIPRSRFKILVYVSTLPYSDTYYPNSNRQRLIAKTIENISWESFVPEVNVQLVDLKDGD